MVVAAPDGGTAYALTQAVHVLGAKEGLALIEKAPGRACLIWEPGPEKGSPLVAHRSSGFAALEVKPAATKS